METGDTAISSENNSHSENLINFPETLKFKFLDNTTQEHNYSKFGNMTIGQIKEFLLPQEINSKSVVKFIYKGRILKDEVIFEDSGIEPNNYIHVVVQESQVDSTSNQQANVDEELGSEPINDQNLRSLMASLRAEEVNNEEYEGTNGHFFLGIAFGYFFQLLALLAMICVRSPEKMKRGALLGFFVKFLVTSILLSTRSDGNSY